MDVFNVGIIGAGWIADKMSLTLAGMEDIKVKAIASRDQAKADAFAKQYGIEKAYGSYELDVKLYPEIQGKLNVLVKGE